MITTKRGRIGAPEFQLSQGVGVSSISHELGERVFRDSVEVDQTSHGFGDLCTLSGGRCPVYNQEDLLGGHHPILSRTSGSLRGGTETTRYFVSGLWDVEPGIIDNTGYNKHSLRVNVDQVVGSRVELDFSTNLVHSNTRRGLTNNDNSGTSYYLSLFSTPSFVNLEPGPIDGVTSSAQFTLYTAPDAPIPIVRNEELILLRAEIALGQNDLATAAQYINFIRVSSGGLPPIANLALQTADSVLTELLYEKRYSLLWEGGFSWLDLRHYNRLLTLLRVASNGHFFERMPFPTNECTPRSSSPPGCSFVNGF